MRVIQVVVVVDLVGERVARGPLGDSSRRRKSLQQRQVTAMDMVETIWPTKFHLRATLLTGERSGLPRNPRLSSAFEGPSFFSRKIPLSFFSVDISHLLQVVWQIQGVLTEGH